MADRQRAAASPVDRQHQALQTIFSFFLGLMVVALVGVGVVTFYPSPESQFEKQMTDINRKIDSINMRAGAKAGTLSAGDQAEMAKLEKQRNDLQDKINEMMVPWVRNTSIILVLCATLVMGVSLYRSDQLRVVSNGLLLGGLFTMIYGAGWSIFAPGTSPARFIVILFALVVTLTLGYVKFVRMRKAAPAEGAEAAAGAPMTAEGVAGLEGRVAAIEARLAAAGDALQRPPE